MARKTFTTTIDNKTLTDFKTSCIEKDVKMNDVLEAFMKAFIDNKFNVEVEFKLVKNK